MKYLLTTTEVYRFNDEPAAVEFIEEAKKQPGCMLMKSAIDYKERKVKGEVIDYWWKVTLVKKFAEEKEPNGNVEVTYQVESAF